MSFFSKLFVSKSHIFNAPEANFDLKILLLLTILQIDFATCLWGPPTADKSIITAARNILLKFGLSLFAKDGDPALIMARIHNFAQHCKTRRVAYENFEYQAAFAEMFYNILHDLPPDFELPVKMDTVRILANVGNSWAKIMDAITLCFRQQKPDSNLQAYAAAYRDAWSQLRGSDQESILKITAPAMGAYLCGHCPLCANGQPWRRFESSYATYLFLEQMLTAMYDPLIAFLGVARLFTLVGDGSVAPEIGAYYCDRPFALASKDQKNGIFSAFSISGAEDDAIVFKPFEN